MKDMPQYLTAEGQARLENELDRLINVRRPEVAAQLKAAIEEGDLSENAGYDEAKRDQAFLEGRIKEIEAILRNARPLEGNGNKDIVGAGSKVTVVESGTDFEEHYFIVGPAEADPAGGRISNHSPLGQALMGHRVGDSIEVNSPGGLIAFEIRSIS